MDMPVTASALCYALGWSLIYMRHQRAVGFLDGIGQWRNKTWYFTANEVVELFLADLLRRHGFSHRRSFAVAHAHAMQIRGAIATTAQTDHILRIPLAFERPYTPRDEAPVNEGDAIAALLVDLTALARVALDRVETAQKSAA